MEGDENGLMNLVRMFSIREKERIWGIWRGWRRILLIFNCPKLGEFFFWGGGGRVPLILKKNVIFVLMMSIYMILFSKLVKEGHNCQ